jgi:hypothetical protein
MRRRKFAFVAVLVLDRLDVRESDAAPTPIGIMYTLSPSRMAGDIGDSVALSPSSNDIIIMDVPDVIDVADTMLKRDGSEDVVLETSVDTPSERSVAGAGSVGEGAARGLRRRLRIPFLEGVIGGGAGVVVGTSAAPGKMTGPDAAWEGGPNDGTGAAAGCGMGATTDCGAGASIGREA